MNIEHGIIAKSESLHEGWFNQFGVFRESGSKARKWQLSYILLEPRWMSKKIQILTSFSMWAHIVHSIGVALAAHDTNPCPIHKINKVSRLQYSLFDNQICFENHVIKAKHSKTLIASLAILGSLTLHGYYKCHDRKVCSEHMAANENETWISQKMNSNHFHKVPFAADLIS